MSPSRLLAAVITCFALGVGAAGGQEPQLPPSVSEIPATVSPKTESFDYIRRDARTVGHTVCHRARAPAHQQSVGVSVVAAGEFYDRVASGRGAREAQRAHRGFGSAAHAAQPLERRNTRAESLGELDFLRGCGTQARAVSSSTNHCIDHRRSGMSSTTC